MSTVLLLIIAAGAHRHFHSIRERGAPLQNIKIKIEPPGATDGKQTPALQPNINRPRESFC
jgi:hypothetical protein